MKIGGPQSDVVAQELHVKCGVHVGLFVERVKLNDGAFENCLDEMSLAVLFALVVRRELGHIMTFHLVVEAFAHDSIDHHESLTRVVAYYGSNSLISIQTKVRHHSTWETKKSNSMSTKPVTKTTR